MSENIALGLCLVLALGISAQWLAWKIKLPSILLLLGFGIIAGPVTGVIDPDALMGDLLGPFVSISVAIILFEGGLSLKMSEFRKIGGTVIKLITIGVLVTWVLASIAALYFLELDAEIAVLFGAVLIVTGPTVIIPLLRQVRPTETAGSIIKWEGIVNDPIGAMMAVLVFDIIISGGFQNISSHALVIITQSLAYGTFFGALGAGFMYFTLKRHLIPDFLQNPVTLMVVVVIFVLSNALQHESGLMSVTVMGIILANQSGTRINHIIEFKENLQVLLISALFILLASRLKVEHLCYFNWSSLAFIGVLILIVRPAAIFLSTIGSKLELKEKLFISWMAPRGIVAAAISAVFALRLEQSGYAAAEQLVPYTFLVIIATVIVYGLTAAPVAKWLGVAKAKPNGILIIGAPTWVRKMGRLLKDSGVQVMVADSNWDNVSKARMMGIDTYYGNILSDYAFDELNLEGIGVALAMTPNDEVNSLASIRFGSLFGSSKVFQLAPLDSSRKKDSEVALQLGGRTLFDNKLNYSKLSDLCDGEFVMASLPISYEHTIGYYKRKYTDKFYPLFLINKNHLVEPFSLDNPPIAQEGDTIIALLSREEMNTQNEKSETQKE